MEISNTIWQDLSKIESIQHGQLVLVDSPEGYHLARYDKKKDIWVEERTGRVGHGARSVLILPDAPKVTVPADFTKGRFTIEPNGDLTIHVKPGYDYETDKACLKDKYFVGNIAGKTWPNFDFGTFMKAYFAACYKSGIREITIDTSYFAE